MDQLNTDAINKLLEEIDDSTESVGVIGDLIPTDVTEEEFEKGVISSRDISYYQKTKLCLPSGRIKVASEDYLHRCYNCGLSSPMNKQGVLKCGHNPIAKRKFI
jgi:hypothetical protein